MTGNQNTIDALKKLLAEDPSILDGAAGSGDLNEASAALARHAQAKGISVDAEAVAAAFQEREGAGQPVEELDDAALEGVSGGGSPYCMFTKGCYCIFTK